MFSKFKLKNVKNHSYFTTASLSLELSEPNTDWLILVQICLDYLCALS